jgi:hypothetical protein
MHNYHDARQNLPPAWFSDWTPVDVPVGIRQQSKADLGYSQNDISLYAWTAFIMPYIEQTAMWDRMDTGQVPLWQRYVDPEKKPNAEMDTEDKALLQTALTCYRCPSDGTPNLHTGTTVQYNQDGTVKENYDEARFGKWNPPPFGVATSNYVASAGNADPAGDNGTRDSGGVFYGNSELKLPAISDGTSNTFAVGERCGMKGGYNYHAAAWAGNGIANGNGRPGASRVIFRSQLAWYLNAPAKATMPDNDGKYAASVHVGGGQFAICDGSVRFVTETINPEMYVNIAIRNDGQSVSF